MTLDGSKIKIKNRQSQGGFTLMELLVVVAILSIIISIALPKFNHLQKKASESVCDTNREIVLKEYRAYLMDKNHSEEVFNQFIQERYDSVCPENGTYTYENGIVRCSVHSVE
jgi:prepilin-type N-terminal cleavage/methylation domain-containing protein